MYNKRLNICGLLHVRHNSLQCVSTWNLPQMHVAAAACEVLGNESQSRT
jgi:hypothetical protein